MFKLFRLAALVPLCIRFFNIWLFSPRKTLKPLIPPAAEMREL